MSATAGRLRGEQGNLIRNVAGITLAIFVVQVHVECHVERLVHFIAIHIGCRLSRENGDILGAAACENRADPSMM